MNGPDEARCGLWADGAIWGSRMKLGGGSGEGGEKTRRGLEEHREHELSETFSGHTIGLQTTQNMRCSLPVCI